MPWAARAPKLPRALPPKCSTPRRSCRGLNAGIDGFNRWSFLNRGDLDGQWQLVRTWNPITWDYYTEVAPEPVPYYSYGILTRFTAKHSEVLDTQADEQQIVAAALRSGKGQITIYVLNKSDAHHKVSVSLAGLQTTLTLQRYQVTEPAMSQPDFRMEPQRSAEVSPAKAVLDEVLPPKSITVFSTFKLSHVEAGISVD